MAEHKDIEEACPMLFLAAETAELDRGDRAQAPPPILSSNCKWQGASKIVKAWTERRCSPETKEASTRNRTRVCFYTLWLPEPAPLDGQEKESGPFPVLGIALSYVTSSTLFLSDVTNCTLFLSDVTNCTLF